MRWSLEGAALDTVWVPNRESGKYWTVSLKRDGKNVSMMSTSIPFMPGQTHSLHPDGGFVIGWSGEYQVIRSATGHDSLRVFGRVWTPEPISDARRRAEVESRIRSSAGSWGEDAIRAAFKVEDIPKTAPAFTSLRVDLSGRVWARRPAISDTTRTFFEVFDSTGAYLGPVVVPFKLSDWGNQVWTEDGLVSVIEDAEGRPTVVRLKLAPRP